ncbi:hypothetical protein C4N9_15450 [Pararhodobacter marinus]|uniref:Response regulatory domain-containing protein n=1 Tax=Pararhodobacter marinus TaxID=2184063 RepID=A0A2U2C7F8_9RHOB|nr:response regulator [Pararhodobacter marinus]PWE27826.1 hypothetical protein C4N9_15450 [Pararhodobacter marinus]
MKRANIGASQDHAAETGDDDRPAMRVAVVDDDPFILELVELFINEVSACDVVPFDSPLKALDAIREGTKAFDCLLLDISMPRMDGIELCREIRKVEGYARAPIIMLTAMTERDYVDRAFRAGATDYLTKPIDMLELRARLKSANQIVEALRDAQESVQEKKNDATAFERTAPVLGISGLLDYAALVNYLMQLSRGKLGQVQVAAVALRDADRIVRENDSEVFLALMAEIAQSVSEVFDPLDSVLAYCGGGSFVVMFRDESIRQSAEIEKQVQEVLDRAIAGNRQERLPDVSITISNPINSIAGDANRVRKILDRAIERAHAKAAI